LVIWDCLKSYVCTLGREDQGEGDDSGGIREDPPRFQRSLHRHQHRQDGRQALNSSFLLQIYQQFISKCLSCGDTAAMFFNTVIVQQMHIVVVLCQ
jgi:hypothetical protein